MEEVKLPKEVEVSVGELNFAGDFIDLEDDEISELLGDYLSDTYGFCHKGFKWKGKEDSGDTFICYDIDWDTSESLKEDENRYKEVEHKMVDDKDGFQTDYTMYFDTKENKYVCVFGDNEIYTPESSSFDFETENKEEAYEWFNNYKGFVEESLKEDAEDIDVEAEVEVEEPKEDAKEPKLETFEEKIDFLIGDEDEAIAGYDKIIAMLDKEADANAIEQLTHLKEEEVVHKDFLEVLKKDPSAIYNHEDKEEEPKENDDDKIEVSNAEFIDDIALDDIDDEMFGESVSVEEDFDDDFGFNHIIDDDDDFEKLGTVNWDDLDDEDAEIIRKGNEAHKKLMGVKQVRDAVVDNTLKDFPERKRDVLKKALDMKFEKPIEEDSHNTGHIKAKKPIELKARVEK